MKTIKIFVILLLQVTLINQVFSQEFPITFDSKNLNLAKNDIKKWNDKFVSTKCVVGDVEEVRTKSYFKCNIDNENYVWVAEITKDKNVRKNDTITFLGIIFKVKKNDKEVLKYNNEGLNLIILALINNTDENRSYILPPAEKKFIEWKNGIITQDE